MTTKDYLDEYAELWEVQHKGSEDTVERNYRKLEELAKELEAGIRKEVVDEVIARVKEYKNYYNPIGDEVNQERHRTAENIIKMIKGITLK